MGKQPAERTTLILEPAIGAADAVAHVTVACGHTQQAQHLNEIRIGALVEDYEARVDGVMPAEDLESDRVRMAARIVVGLEDMYVVVIREQAGREQPADTGSDNGNLHGITPPVCGSAL